MNYQESYNFKRLSKPGETSWNDVLNRFISELVGRGAKTPKEDLEWLLLNYYAVPNSPALLTAGNKKFYASACFKENQEILTQRGRVPISSVVVGDLVTSHTNSLQPVTRLFKKPYSGKFVEIKVRGVGTILTATPEHPFRTLIRRDIACVRGKNLLCRENRERCKKKERQYSANCKYKDNSVDRYTPTWQIADNLREGDYVQVAVDKTITDKKEIDLSIIFDKGNSILLHQGDFLRVKYSKESDLIPRIITIDNDFMRLLGYWYAEGHTTGGDLIGWTINKKDLMTQQDIVDIIYKKFNKSVNIETTEDLNFIQIRLHSVIVANVFEKLFGKGAFGKKIPLWVRQLPLEKQLNLLIGLFRGDGSVNLGIHKGTIKISLVNKELIDATWEMLIRLGVGAQFGKTKSAAREYYSKRDKKFSTFPEKTMYYCTFSGCQHPEIAKLIFGVDLTYNPHTQYLFVKGELYYKIDKIKNTVETCDVYNFSVLKDESYSVEGVAVHNCSSYPIFDTMFDHKFGIMPTLNMSAKAVKAGVGVGYSFSQLRASTESVGNFGCISGGPVSFLRGIGSFNLEITQATRKSAAMGLLDVDHPDIEKFITCKDKDKEIQGFNLSVILDNNFMEKAIAGENYNKITRKLGNRKEIPTDAGKILDLIAKQAWKNGEPGVFFADAIIDDYFEKLDKNHILANPCFTGDTLITTDKGLFPIKDLVGKVVSIHDGEQWRTVDNFRVTGTNQEIIKITLFDGSEIKVTPYHTMILEDGTRIKAKDLRLGDSLKENLIETNGIIETKGAYLKGFLLGDGTTKDRCSASLPLYSTKYMCEGRLIQSALEIPEEQIKATYIKTEVDFIPNSGGDRRVMRGLSCRRGELFKWVTDYRKSLPREIFQWDLKSKCEFIAGYMDADGTAGDNKNGFRYQIASIHRQLLLDFQILLKTLGINSSISILRRGGVTDFRDGYGEYKTKDCFRLSIHQVGAKKLSNLVSFSRLVSFSNKQISNVHKTKKFNITKLENQTTLEEKVYCCTVSGTHSLTLSTGNLTGNCSEAILSYGEDWLELCVLGSINLPKYSKLPTEDRRRVVHILTSLLNDIIDVQDYFLPEHELGMKNRNRKIGIGVAGLATVFATNGIKYSKGSDITKAMFKEIGEFALEKSGELGNILGLGRNNASLLSVAPTSSISSIFNDINEEGCSFGIEPYFSIKPSIIHNSLGDFEKREKVVDFLKGEIYHIETANELTYQQHLSHVEAYYTANQRGITQGASKTINFSNKVSVDDIKEAIIYCWKHKIKAISFYRDGSREGQVFSEIDSRPTKVKYHSAPKRPQSLPCKVHTFKAKGVEYVLLLGLLENAPFEIFCGTLDSLKDFPTESVEGVLSKSKTYDLHLDELVYKDLPQLFYDKTDSTNRLLSMALRHGIPLQYICDQLAKDNDMAGINRGCARILKKYITEKVKSSEDCDCGNKMIYVSGCLTCGVCGASKCS